MKSILSFLTLLLLCASVSAQRADSALAVYGARFPQEKIYVHLDRARYNKGETIWFKAYLLEGQDPSALSKTIYFDWSDGAGKLLKHIAAPIFEASAKGQFDIPADFAGGSLHLRAYTRWMLNFDSAFLYDKDIAVAGSGKPAAPGKTELTFFPEGGDLVTGLISKVAFKANNQWGIPVTVSGVVQGSDGSLVDSLTVVHDGMGSFIIQPAAGVTYTAAWTDGAGGTHHVVLPAAAENGVILQVQQHPGRSLCIVRRTERAPHAFHLIVHMNQSAVYAADLHLEDKPEAALEVPTDKFPTGVAQFTLFDDGWRPVAERVVFVNNQQHVFTPTINVLTGNTAKRARNEVEIAVPDSLWSNMSVSVTDGDLAASDEDIVSRLLLCDDIRGAVYKPAYYFTGSDPALARQLDLVMLTHGWRRFKWNEVLAGRFPVLRFPPDTDFLEIRGQVDPRRVHDLTPGQPVLLILQSRDSSRQRLLLPVSPDGHFAQTGVTFYDTLRVYYDFAGSKKLGDISLQNGLLPPPGNMPPVGSFADSTGAARVGFFAAQEAERWKKSKAINLASITIKADARHKTELLDAKYTTGFFKRDAGFQFDVMDDPLAQHSVDIFYYLKQVVPGLDVQYKDGNPILRWRQSSPSLFVDEVGTRADIVAGIPISDIAYVKVFHPPFLLGAVSNPRAGAIAIYTKQGEDIKPIPVKGLNYHLLEGYSAERQFYSPDYSVDPASSEAFLPDVRATLYWNPYVLTDAETHSVRLEFYNNDVSRRLRIVLEGINAAGKLTRVEKTIE